MLRNHGFTLIELIVAMVIIGILTAIALPNYTEYVRRSNRAEARGQILALALWMDRWRTQNGRFDDPASPGSPPPTIPATLLQAPATGAARYTIAVVATARTYALTATATGNMAGDVCTTLAIDQTGLRTFTTGGGGTQQICWGR
jgi:type IV pilus assembly protein PilE